MSDILHTAALHLICGQAGSGKTTYAKQLEMQLSAFRFSKDEWMVSLLRTGHHTRTVESVQTAVLRLHRDHREATTLAAHGGHLRLRLLVYTRASKSQSSSLTSPLSPVSFIFSTSRSSFEKSGCLDVKREQRNGKEGLSHPYCKISL
jgi:hypothetical protein